MQFLLFVQNYFDPQSCATWVKRQTLFLQTHSKPRSSLWRKNAIKEMVSRCKFVLFPPNRLTTLSLELKNILVWASFGCLSVTFERFRETPKKIALRRMKNSSAATIKALLRKRDASLPAPHFLLNCEIRHEYFVRGKWGWRRCLRPRLCMRHTLRQNTKILSLRRATQAGR